MKTLNKHMLKFGYEHRRYYDNVTNGANAYALATGRTVKRGAYDSGWNDEDFVDSFAGFLQGYISHSAASGCTRTAPTTSTTMPPMSRTTSASLRS